jgi:hypothetical protein
MGILLLSLSSKAIKMTTETITLTQDATLAMLLKGVVKKRDRKYVITIDGNPVFEVNAIADTYDDTIETPEDRQAYENAKIDLENGVNRSTLDFNKVQTFADFEKFLKVS